METYCVSCNKYIANKNSSVRKIKQNRLTLFSNLAVYDQKKSTSINNKELRNFND